MSKLTLNWGSSTSQLSFPYQLLESSSTLQYRIHRHIHGLRRKSKSLQKHRRWRTACGAWRTRIPGWGLSQWFIGPWLILKSPKDRSVILAKWPKIPWFINGGDRVITETSLGMILEGGDNSWGSLFRWWRSMKKQRHLHGNFCHPEDSNGIFRKKHLGLQVNTIGKKHDKHFCCDLLGMVFCGPL